MLTLWRNTHKYKNLPLLERHMRKIKFPQRFYDSNIQRELLTSVADKSNRIKCHELTNAE